VANGTKYALLLLPTIAPRDEDQSVRQLAPDIITWRGTLLDIIDKAEVQHWKEWLGEIEWREMTHEQRFVLAFMASERAEVIDAESEQLRAKAMVAWYATLLVAPVRPFHGVCRAIGGQAHAVSPEARLLSIKQAGQIGTVERPLYASTSTFTKVMPWREPDPWFEHWCDWIRTLDQISMGTLPQILDVALFAFRMALCRNRLEFSIPEFVRTAECILGVPKNGGARVFTERALRIAPQLAHHWYVGGRDPEDRIRAVYQHRSNCVHGKVPFLELDAKGEAGKDEAAQLEYLAESLARACLQVAFRSTGKFPEFASREILEDAWANGRFP